ncbi:MAG: hypothetical protein J0M35_08935 [Candidatus Obscuribacter phosphatis]|uniref:Translation elongation factor n=1 Tax=Candidatus Obscuribacter phosphatis TaxID=1906157 RepID=A0A8J7PA60_9BACT|nr:hypothetical protein [Candidatus Obscuribacter phosphatis]
MSLANDTAWQDFLQRSYALGDLQARGLAFVNADALKPFREPRLMAKLDTLSERPLVFRDYGLNILPVQNGLYCLFRDPDNKLYYRFEDCFEKLETEAYQSKVDLQSFDSFKCGGSLSSESQVIDYAYLSGLLQTFCADEALQLTIRGRSFTGQFNLTLPEGQVITVSNVQVEIDAGYESADNLILIEAKIGRRSDFNIRQLLFPFYQWRTRTHKPVRPIFLTYSNGEIVLTEFRIGESFGEIEVVSNRSFVINDNPAALIDFDAALAAVPLLEEPAALPDSIPFPQADDMDRLVDLVQFIAFEPASKSKIAEHFEFEERQADYYGNAAAYLGLARRNRGSNRGFEITEAGSTFLSIASRTQRTRALLARMLAVPSLRESLILLAQRDFDVNAVKNFEVQEILSRHTSLKSGSDTCYRRAITVKMWLSWLSRNSIFQEKRQYHLQHVIR